MEADEKHARHAAAAAGLLLLLLACSGALAAAGAGVLRAQVAGCFVPRTLPPNGASLDVRGYCSRRSHAQSFGHVFSSPNKALRTKLAASGGHTS